MGNITLSNILIGNKEKIVVSESKNATLKIKAELLEKNAIIQKLEEKIELEHLEKDIANARTKKVVTNSKKQK